MGLRPCWRSATREGSVSMQWTVAEFGKQAAEHSPTYPPQ
jgi:hypothetical protein